uniref:DUF218 domain-containing protein n=1 Tax=uncultured marine group II/III euryarchaeote KM3_83_G03 TaxID=1456522 RepID=A0A075HVT9_9EURY|nr:hypothetical protein [uncultured marine group II/III euryarchaeote KM3_83_G03]
MADTLFLLSGENEATRPRSMEVLRQYQSGSHGIIMVSGGYGGLDKLGPGKTEPQSERTAYWLMNQGVPQENVFWDPRPLDTLGNFAFPFSEPYADPASGRTNPTSEEMGFMMLVTEDSHMKRALELALKSVDSSKIYPQSVEGPPKSKLYDLLYGVYHSNLLFALRDTEGDPEASREFLETEHFYHADGWFDKHPKQRLLESMIRGTLWRAQFARHGFGL